MSLSSFSSNSLKSLPMTVKTSLSFAFPNIIILLILFIVHLTIFWPGIMSSDSMTQYQMALQGKYTDHHPALMSFVWRYLDQIHKGSGLLLVLHLSWLYGGIYLLQQCFEDKRYNLIMYLIPFFPNVLIYSGMIWKDVGFAFSFFYVGAVLSRLTIKERPLKFWEHIFLWISLFYGTSVKFQAQYCAPIFLLWYIYQHISCGEWKLWQKIRAAIFIFLSFYLGLMYVNRLLIPVQSQDYSWQYVKLYDLAAISTAEKTSFFPPSMLKDNFTLEKLYQQFSPERVDDLVFGPEAILQKDLSPKGQQHLWQQWARAVTSHPIHYLTHRFRNLSYALVRMPGMMVLQTKISYYFADKPLFFRITSLCAYIFAALFLGHFLYVFLSIFYLGLGIRNLSRTKFAIPLVALNLTSFMMLISLLFFSMAGTPRYTYIIICLCHASHFFAWKTWKR